MLVSALNGLYLISGPRTFRKIDFPGVDSCTFMSLRHLGKFYLLATANRGFILYNTVTHTASRFTGKDGLNSDFVYSVAHDHQNQIWLGTGRGVNKLLLDTASGEVRISDISTPGDISSSEYNQNAAVYDRQRHLWFGTASGLMKFFPENDSQRYQYIPPVVLRGVELFSKEIPPGQYADSATSGYRIPYHLKLPHDQNHLSFEFGCASYLNGEKIRYQYQLEGMEKEFSAPASNRFVVYSGLPPGEYIFRVRAILPGYGFSGNTISYPFTISAAFYQTLLFKLALVLVAVGLVLWMQWLRMNQRIRRLKQIEAIKKEENISVRQSTAEDFHDEVGNTLTRIQVLTDVLQARIGAGSDEGNRLIAQIKENVSNLYRGTRDILWALNPGSDRLSEVAARLEIMGIEIFQDTAVEFRFENRIPQSNEMVLPPNYGRNILLIFKDAMNNGLRHAGASRVVLEIDREGLHHISILLKDNGAGFEPDLVKKGYGTGNMAKRAGRIHGEFIIDSRPGTGTACRLVVPVPPK
jgi:signal transduction histidine kinase